VDYRPICLSSIARSANYYFVDETAAFAMNGHKRRNHVIKKNSWQFLCSSKMQ